MNPRNLKIKTLSILLTIVMLMGMLPMTAFAAEGAEASVTINGETTEYPTLDKAIQAVKDCTAEDEATVTLLKSVDVEDGQYITSGVFTLDLDGKALTASDCGLFISGGDVTVTDSGTGGTVSGIYGVIVGGGTATIKGGSISGSECGVYTAGATVTIAGGSISGNEFGVYAEGATVTIEGGSISDSEFGVLADGGIVRIAGGIISGTYIGVFAVGPSVTIEGGTISDTTYGVFAESAIVRITGGTIRDTSYGLYAAGTTVTIEGGSNSSYYDFYLTGGTITLTLAEGKTEGATFPGGLTVVSTTLKAILGEGAAYWQDGEMIVLGEGQTSIPGGDVVVKMRDYAAVVTMDGTTTYYEKLEDAIDDVSAATAEDAAVVTLLKSVDQAPGINSGVFTLDLNGKTISGDTYGLKITGGDVTITDSGTGGSISGSRVGMSAHDSDVTINGGTFSGDDCGVSAYDSDVTINGGTFSGDNCGVSVNNSDVTITDGSISGGYYGVSVNNSDVTIEGGTFTGDDCGVSVNYSHMTVTDGSISGSRVGMSAHDSDVTINGSTISGSNYGVFAYGGNVTINSGTISGSNYDLYLYGNGTITLTLAEGAEEGATFTGGLKVYSTTLKAILGEGAAYWQDGKQVSITDGQTEITSGDVTVKLVCDHSGNTNSITSNGNGTHTFSCSVCCAEDETESCAGGTATCEAKAKCDSCGAEYGDTLPHTYGTEWKSDGTNHWHECSCGAKTDEAAHSGGTATCKDKAACSVCTAAYGELAAHTYKDGKCTVCEAADPNYKPPATNPQTGDNSHMALFIALLFISGGAIITLTVYDRKRRNTVRFVD